MTEPQATRPGPWHARASTRDLLVVGAAFLVPLVVYLLTVPPTVTGGDSGEFVTAVYVLGVVHPTGYPLYMLLGKLFQMLVPFGEVAFRLALMSAVFAAASAALVSWVCLRCGAGSMAALLAGLSAAFVSTVWSQAIIAEVYALNAFLVMLGLAAFVVWLRRRTPRSLIVLCAVLGLTIGHHRTGGLALGPFVVAAVLLHRPVSFRALAKAAGAFAAPFLLYAYFPIRSAAFPPACWTNVLGWEAMGRFFMGTDWAGKVLHRRGPEMWAFIGEMLAALRADVTIAGLALALVGWGALAVRSRLLWICSTLAFLLVGAWAATYDVWDAAVFSLPCYLFFGFWLAVGVEAIGRSLARLWRNPRAALLTARVAAGVALVAIPTLEVTAPWRDSEARPPWREVDLSARWDVKERGEVILANTQPGALLLIRGHAYYTTLLYLTLVEGRRPDVLLASSGLLGNLWYQVGMPSRALRLAAEDTVTAAVQKQIPRAGDFSPYLARRFVAHSDESRALYTNFEVSGLPAGYWNKGLPGGLFQITDEPQPSPVRGSLPAREGTAFPMGLELAQANVRPARLRPGEVFALDLYWRPTLAVEQPLQVEASLAPRQPGGESGQEPGFAFWFPLEYGALPLDALDRGQHYRQTVSFVASRTLLPGPCDLRIRVASRDVKSEPATVATLHVEAGGR